MNTWAGVGVPPPPVGAIGLDWYEILLPNEEALRETAVRLQNANISTETWDDALTLHDPSSNRILLRVKP
jgi:catechol 2,3-dioxygenase